ncbi:hypothetical protein M9H77_27506 [Catharanthus roseus]|uniref:Uncharacterized protein n=1 Tax=Catharanthus roseus TaxID=4058 RepID=A0ACC0AFF2_CATRO|nr:hypothetical protein M9H77_27506 [Catharanthus roseus]
MFAPPFRHFPEGCKPYMQMFSQIGYKSDIKLLDICLRLDMITADEYLPCTHPRIQNPGNIPSVYNVPVAPVMPPQALLDMIARECHRQDISSDEFRHRVRDLLRVHYNAL